MNAVNRWSRIFCILGLIALPTSYASRAGATEPESHHEDSDELQMRGKQLRTEIQQKYQELIRTHKLNGRETDITESVIPYIPKGTSFREAETILRNGGFAIIHPDLNQAADLNRSYIWYAVTATISPFAGGFLFSVDAYVYLLPKSPGDYTTVESVLAGFLAISP